VNSHDRAQELISARMDGPLTPAEQRALQEHLATCPSCQVFAGHADALARGLHDLPRLGPSPAVSRAVMSAVSAEASGWDWLRKGLQAISSPGMAVASGLALVLVMTAALLVALNAPSGGDEATSPESTIAAVAVAPLPTEAPTEVPTAVRPHRTAATRANGNPRPAAHDHRSADRGARTNPRAPADGNSRPDRRRGALRRTRD
jgi:anti-sigma factor RsiW